MSQLLEAFRMPSRSAVRQKLVDDACKSRADAVLSGVCLGELDLSGLFLGNVLINGVDFRGSLCRGVIFPPLADCNFDGVDASQSNFTRLERCTFRRGLLSAACFGARMSDCDFGAASMAYARVAANIEDIERFYRGNDFSGADLLGFDGAGGFFAGTRFCGASLVRSRFSRANLCECDFGGADLEEGVLVGAEMQGLNIQGARFERCVVGMEQREQLYQLRGSGIGSLRVAAVDVAGFVHLLARDGEYRIDWRLRDSVSRNEVHFLLLQDARGSRAMAFRAVDELPLMMYHGEDSGLSVVAVGIASDYAGWDVVAESVEVECEDEGVKQAVLRELPTALEKMLIVNG